MKTPIYCISGEFAEFILNDKQLDAAIFKSGIYGYILSSIAPNLCRFTCFLRDAEQVAAAVAGIA